MWGLLRRAKAAVRRAQGGAVDWFERMTGLSRVVSFRPFADALLLAIAIGQLHSFACWPLWKQAVSLLAFVAMLPPNLAQAMDATEEDGFMASLKKLIDDYMPMMAPQAVTFSAGALVLGAI